MTVLTKEELTKKIEDGSIIIEPYSEEMIGPGSIDLTLDNNFRLYRKDAGPYDITDDNNIDRITEEVVTDKLILRPGEACLGITKEKVTLAPNLCGWLEGRSRFARVGLMIHTTAGFIHPGTSNKSVLEISNISPFPLVLHAGTRICQIIVEDTVGQSRYEGRFKDQVKP